MYRFFKVPGVALQNVCKPTSIPRTCLFCNFCHRRDTPKYYTQIRHNSTTINNVMLSSVGKRKLKRRTKKYAELLEVTDSTTNNRKAAVQNLNAAQLSILVDQPDITLDKLHKIKETHVLKKSKRSFATSPGSTSIDQIHNPTNTDFMDFQDSFNPASIKKFARSRKLIEKDTKDEEESITEELQTSGINDETLLIKSTNLVDSMHESTEGNIANQEAVILEKSEEVDHLEESEEKIIDKERKAREALIQEEKLKQFNNILLGYMDVCVNSGATVCGDKAINLYGRKKKAKSTELLYINDVSVYNVHIEKLAREEDFEAILKLVQNLRKNSIALNPQTYTYILGCISRMNKTDEYKLSLLKKIELEMEKDGVSLNDIITKSTFVLDQRTHVKSMINLLDSNFEPNYKAPDTGYDCRLLKNLSEETAKPSSTIEGLLDVSELGERLKKQIEVEIDGQVTVRNISRKTGSNQSVTNSRRKIANLEKLWEDVAMKAFKRHLVTLKSRESLQRGRKMALYPYLSILKPEDYIRLIMREVKNLGMGSEMYSLPFNSLCRQMGVQVYKMYEAKTKQSYGVNDKISEIYMQYCDWFVKRNDKLNFRAKWTELEHEANKSGVTSSATIPSWPTNIHSHIGRFLFNIIINDLKVEVGFMRKKKSHNPHSHYAPAFFKIFRHSGVMLKEEVKPHPYVAKLYRDSQPEMLTFDTTLVPSLCPPRPWVSIHSGGYIVTKSDVVRITNTGNQQWDRLVNSPPKKLYPALDSLNQLGSIPWTINSSVLDVAIKVFQNDGSVELNMPQPPSVLKPIPSAPRDADPNEKRQIEKQRIELKRKKNEMYSLWCDALYRLSLASHFRNEIFWLPHNMDFRGRVYPVPPHLNHLGSDLARSMLVFALKKPLGPKGLEWLKLHCINLTGFKKRDPVSERLKYADEIIDKILDSAANPLDGEMWWSKSDEPWQTLSACMEIAEALKCPNPEEYMSGFPIHQDGSCNGLQHYAALGRDQIGAESVNLYPSHSPQDVYSSVATMVDERRKEDAENGHLIAQVLDGFIKRKVIKQTVMTTVYGVTWFGAKLQIARQLKDLDDFPQEHLWPASTYLVQKTFQTLRTMFKSAREIQDWFTECARLICVCREQNMEWVTPLGLPVVQPYSKITKSASRKNLSPFFSPDIYRRPNVMKQKNAFAPNYVHSLDSSHMMLTSVHSEHAGITFVSVHDCYWTHPCTVEIMNKICREQFVALHSEPILDDLSKFFIDKFGYNDSEIVDDKKDEKNSGNYPLKTKLNTTLTKVPKQGDFDLNGVLRSTYFFS